MGTFLSRAIYFEVFLAFYSKEIKGNLVAATTGWSQLDIARFGHLWLKVPKSSRGWPNLAAPQIKFWRW